MNKLRIATLELFSTGTMFPPATPQQRNLGGAIFLVAIEDYRHTDEQIHQNAADFLYPRTAEWQAHFHWAVSLTEGLDEQWLREELDHARGKWDQQRRVRLRQQGRTRYLPSARRKACVLTRGAQG